jgi:microcystin degradation protein MlrC
VMRIVIGGIANESCMFSPLPTKREDFDVLRGEGLLTRHPYLAGLEEVTFIPLFRARAMPGGPVAPAAYEAFKLELLHELRTQGPWGGVYLDLHGAL